jgi:hypothetical protein
MSEDRNTLDIILIFKSLNVMTKAEFLSKALLKIAGNSAFGNHKRGSYQSFFEWAQVIMEAATELTALAIKNGIVEADEPDKPP